MGIHKKRTAGSIVCILLTALFSVLAVSGCAKTEDAAAGSVEQEGRYRLVSALNPLS